MVPGTYYTYKLSNQHALRKKYMQQKYCIDIYAATFCLFQKVLLN